MKSVLYLTLVSMTLILGSCSKTEENDNPVIGFWDDRNIPETSLSAKVEKGAAALDHEWIFNDAYLGRYQTYENNKTAFKTDFRWSEENGVYTISYPGTNLPNDIVTMKGSLDGDLLEFSNGYVLALRN